MQVIGGGIVPSLQGAGGCCPRHGWHPRLWLSHRLKCRAARLPQDTHTGTGTGTCDLTAIGNGACT